MFAPWSFALIPAGRSLLTALTGTINAFDQGRKAPRCFAGVGAATARHSGEGSAARRAMTRQASRPFSELLCWFAGRLRLLSPPTPPCNEMLCRCRRLLDWIEAHAPPPAPGCNSCRMPPAPSRLFAQWLSDRARSGVWQLIWIDMQRLCDLETGVRVPYFAFSLRTAPPPLHPPFLPPSLPPPSLLLCLASEAVREERLEPDSPRFARAFPRCVENVEPGRAGGCGCRGRGARGGGRGGRRRL